MLKMDAPILGSLQHRCMMYCFNEMEWKMERIMERIMEWNV